MINAGVIGLGVGEQHLKTLLEHPYISKVYIFDHNVDKLKEVYLRNPAAIVVTKESDIICNNNCQLVCIASYDTDHCRQILECITFGQHTFVEKPVCLFLEEAQSIIKCLRANPEIRFSSNLILRKSARFVDLKSQIQSNVLGNIYAIDADYYYGRVNKLLNGWRQESDFYSVFLGGGVHMVDLVRWLTGKEAISVFAVANKIVTKSSAFRYDDYVSASISFEDGILGRISANFGCVHPHYHELKIFGTEATFINDRESAMLYDSRVPEDKPKIINTEYPGCKKGDLLNSFLDEISKDCSPSYTIEDIFETMAVCFAVERSVSQNSPIMINEIRKELNLL